MAEGVRPGADEDARALTILGFLFALVMPWFAVVAAFVLIAQRRAAQGLTITVAAAASFVFLWAPLLLSAND
jgi:hypothetical protein